MKKYKINLRVIALSCLIALALSPSLMGQKPNYKFKSVNQPDGLINSTIQVIFEDSFGFIWLGTHHGIQRYDGKTYKNYVHSDLDSNSLSKNFINGFCEDSDRNIWIITSGGLNKYDRKTDRITRYKWHKKLHSRFDEPNLMSLYRDDSDGNILWFTGMGIGLIKLNVLTDNISVYSTNEMDNKLSRWILPYPGKKDQLLLGSESLLSFNKVTGEFVELFQLEQNADIPDNLINDVVSDPSDQDIIWLATGDYWGRGSLGGLIKYDLKSGSMFTFTPETRKEDMPDRHLLCLYFSDIDHLWIGTRYASALLYDRSENRFYNYSNNEFDPGSFSSDYAVRSIRMDRSGTLWFGTWGDGISLLSPAAQKFSRYIHLPQDQTTLPDNYINTFAEDKEGNIWIGTKAGGLSKFDPRQKTFENYFREFSSSGANPTEITYLFYDSHKNLWIGTYDDALYRYSPGSGTKIHYKKGISKNDVTQNRISAITELKPGEILLSTYGGGLNIYSYSTDSFRHFVHNPDDSASIQDNQVWLPFLGKDGNYYLSGNSGAGLLQFNPGTEKFSEVIPRGNTSTFIMPCVTSDGRVFINAVAEGLREIVFSDEILINTVNDEFGNNIKNIESLVADDENMLWLGTGNGLLKYDTENKTVQRYDADDGLQGFEFNRLAAFKASTGEMYFGGKNGFSVFHPNSIKLSNYEPPVVFTGLKIFQEEVVIGEDSPLKQNILLSDKIELAHDQNDFSISFAALDFSNPQKINYKYILDNHDEEWINAGQINYASYTNMDPGRYTLKVLATNGDGLWNKEPKSFQIIIHPPWWLTTWAYGFYILLFAAAGFGVNRFMRNRVIQKEHERSRAFKLEQAKKIEKAYNELKATQAQLIHAEKMASLGELTAGIAHEIQNPLNFVNNFADVNTELIAEMRQEINQGNYEAAKAIANDIKDNEQKISHHGKRADTIVKGMLMHSRISSGLKEPTDINGLADEYLRLAYHGLRAKDKSFNAAMKTDFDESIGKINIIPQDIGRVILNLFTNAFYAVDQKKKQLAEDLSALPNLTGQNDYEPTVTVSTSKEGNKVLISVKDNGNGIPDEIKDKIFQPFFTTKPTGEGTGLGLSLSYDIITKGHGGSLSVESSNGDGSIFRITLPLEVI